MNQLNFGQALDAIKAGKRIARTGWNGKGMFVYLVPPASYPVQTGAAKAHFGAGAMVPYNAYMAIKNVDGTVSTWVPSVNDCLAADWGVVGEAAPGPVAFGDEEHVAVPRGLICAACSAIEQKRDARITLAELRRYTFGDKSKAISPAAPIALPVVDPGLDSLEREIQAKANRAPRVTPADIEGEIASEHYFTAEDGVGRASKGQTSNGGKNPASLFLLTFCVLVLRNGFTVTGESACASPENFNAEIGRRIARENAVSKVWPLLGFRLRDKLSGHSA